MECVVNRKRRGLRLRTVSLSEEREKGYNTHNDNVYSGSAVCPLRKFLRTRAASTGRKFPLTHTHTRSKIGHKE